MPKWMPVLGLSIAAASGFAAPAVAQRNPIEGPWQQVETNAGDCATCRIDITRRAGVLEVAANNGWSAVVAVPGSDDRTRTSGNGAWSTESRGWVSGRPFDIVLRIVDQRLHMSMSVELADGSRRHVQAVFERIWLGA